VPFRLSKNDQALKTKFMAEAWMKHSALCDIIDKNNSTTAMARKEVELASSAYRQTTDDMLQFTIRIKKIHSAQFKLKPSKWKASIAGKTITLWLRAYGAFRPARPEFKPPLAVTYPSETILTAFEELADKP
jgi:hypothetical protein